MGWEREFYAERRDTEKVISGPRFPFRTPPPENHRSPIDPTNTLLNVKYYVTLAGSDGLGRIS